MSKESALCGTYILLIGVRWRCSEEAGVVRHRGKLTGYHKRDLTLTLRDRYLVYRSVLMLGPQHMREIIKSSSRKIVKSSSELFNERSFSFGN